MTTQAIEDLRAEAFIMSTSAIADVIAFHRTVETAHVKPAMFEASSRRILLADHMEFGERALRALAPPSDFDIVVLDEATPEEDVRRLRRCGVEVVVARAADARSEQA